MEEHNEHDDEDDDDDCSHLPNHDHKPPTALFFLALRLDDSGPIPPSFLPSLLSSFPSLLVITLLL